MISRSWSDFFRRLPVGAGGCRFGSGGCRAHSRCWASADSGWRVRAPRPRALGSRVADTLRFGGSPLRRHASLLRHRALRARRALRGPGGLPSAVLAWGWCSFLTRFSGSLATRPGADPGWWGCAGFLGWEELGSAVGRVEPDLPGGVVDDAVVVAAEQDQVRQGRDAAVGPVDDVVGVGHHRGSGAAGERAVVVAADQGPPDRRGDQPVWCGRRPRPRPGCRGRWG